MITCPNKNLKEWVDLVSQVGEARAYLLWDITKGDTTKLDDKKPSPVKLKDDIGSKLTSKDIYGKRYIQPIGSTGQYRILKDWKAKGLSLVKKLENEYPGVLSWKTVNNEVIISVNPQMGLKFSKESSTEKVSEDVLIESLLY